MRWTEQQKALASRTWATEVATMTRQRDRVIDGDHGVDRRIHGGWTVGDMADLNEDLERAERLAQEEALASAATENEGQTTPAATGEAKNTHQQVGDTTMISTPASRVPVTEDLVRQIIDGTVEVTRDEDGKFVATSEDGVITALEIRTPPFGPPKDHPAPRWAQQVGQWMADEPDFWLRDISRPLACDADLYTCEKFDGERVEALELTLCFNERNFEGTPDELAATMRELATSLHAAADALTGPPKRGARGSQGAYHARVCERIQGHVKAGPTRQNELAVAAGYGTADFSDMMTGRVPIDMNDLERIAGALGVNVLDLAVEG